MNSQSTLPWPLQSKPKSGCGSPIKIQKEIPLKTDEVCHPMDELSYCTHKIHIPRLVFVIPSGYQKLQQSNKTALMKKEKWSEL